MLARPTAAKTPPQQQQRVQHIHFVWLQGAENLRVRQPALWKYVQSWAAHFPHWRSTMWDDEMIVKLLRERFEPAVLDAYTKLPKLAMKSDVGRYAIVYTHGGMYVDTDMECLRNFEHLLSRTGAPNALFSLDGALLEGAFCNNCWFYFPTPRGPALRALLSSIATDVRAQSPHALATALHGAVFAISGPHAFLRALQANPPVEFLTRALLEPITANNMHLDIDGDGARARFPDAFAIHHPQGSWMNVNGAFLKWFGNTWGQLRGQLPIVFPVIVGVLLLAILALSIVMLVQAKRAAVRRRNTPSQHAVAATRRHNH